MGLREVNPDISERKTVGRALEDGPVICLVGHGAIMKRIGGEKPVENAIPPNKSRNRRPNLAWDCPGGMPFSRQSEGRPAIVSRKRGDPVWRRLSGTDRRQNHFPDRNPFVSDGNTGGRVLH